MTDDEDGKDTQVLRANQVPFDLEGTEEMDRAALLAAIQADNNRSVPTKRESSEVLIDARETEALPSVVPNTVPTMDGPKRHDATQHYVVPDSLLEQVRDPGFRTLDVPMEAIDQRSTQPFATTSFTAVIDQNGRIQLPDIALTGQYRPGRRIRVIIELDDD